LGACATTFTHYDGDGFIDLFIANCNEVNSTRTPIELLRNNGNLTFTDVRNSAGTSAGGFWEGITLGDYDNDGDLDLFVTNFGGAAFGHALYENQGNGTYRNRATQARIVNLELGWGASFADFDNDGFQDLFLAGSLPVAGFNVIGPGRGNPGHLLMNNQDKTFRKEASFGLASKFTSGVAVGDFDNNGFPDVLVVTSKFLETTPRFNPDGRPVLLQNAGNSNHWLTIKTVGTKSNRDGIGAHVVVTSGDLRQIKEVRAGSSMASMDSPWLTFGLGQRTRADIEVRWPSGLRERFVANEADRMIALTEGTGQDPDSTGRQLSVEHSDNELWLRLPQTTEGSVIETALEVTGPWTILELSAEAIASGRIKLGSTQSQSYFRLRGYPFNEELAAFVDAHERVYVIEQNRDAQLLQLMKLELTPEQQTKLRSVLHYNGLPIDARSITDDVLAQEGFEVAKKTSRISAGIAGGE
jgi:hypothetical protein